MTIDIDNWEKFVYPYIDCEREKNKQRGIEISMKSILKKVSSKSLAGGIVGFVILMVLGAFFAFATNEDFFDFLLAKDSVFGCPVEELNNDSYYDVTNSILYDWYAEDDEGRYYITDHYDGDDNVKYMGYYIYNKDCDKADQIVDEVYAFLDGEEDAPSFLKGHGYVYPMGSDEIEFFNEYFDDVPSIDRSELEYQTIVLVPFSEAIKSASIFPIIIGLAMMIGAIIVLLRAIFGFQTKKILKYVEKYDISEDAVNGDEMYFTKEGKLLIGRRFIANVGNPPFILPFDKIIWAYPVVNRTRHMLYGVIPTGTTKSYAICLCTTKKEEIRFTVTSEKQSEKIMELINKSANASFLGYSDELSNAYSSNFNEMLEAFEQRKMQF